MRPRFALAAFLDKWESRLRRVGEHLGWPQAWLHEFIDYRGDPRMTLEEFNVRFTLKRMEAEPRITGQLTEAQARDFYTTSDYLMWRNLVHRRHTAWRRVLWTMRGRHGTLLEYGCGIAPISAWVSRARPTWLYHPVDLPSPHLDYARWRLRGVVVRAEESLMCRYDVATLIDVLEHLPDPETVTRDVVRRIVPGGYLHVNFVGNPKRNDLDLATPEQREATVDYLYRNMGFVAHSFGHLVLRKLR